MKFNDWPRSFLCDNHLENKFINRTICNVYFNNAQNLSTAKCEEKLYNNLKKGKERDDTRDWNKTLRLQYCLSSNLEGGTMLNNSFYLMIFMR